MQEHDLQAQQLKKQLNKIMAEKPNHLPIYLIINQQTKSELPDLPIMLFEKHLTMAQIATRLQQKYPKFKYLYLFGKEQSKHQHQQNGQHSNLSKKEKKKIKQHKCCDHDHQQKVMLISKQNQQVTFEQNYNKYKDPNDFLTLVISEQLMTVGKQPNIKQIFFILMALICAVAYIYLSVNDEDQGNTI